eukprot:8168655-Prorocentrum_lima.AAC.1
MEAINPGTWMKMSSADREQWVDAIRAELPYFKNLEVFDQVMPEEIKAMRREGIYPKILPGRLILVKKLGPREHHGWEPKARVVCCGNFGEGTVGGDWKNRAEAPGSMEFRTLLAIATKKQWSI